MHVMRFISTLTVTCVFSLAQTSIAYQESTIAPIDRELAADYFGEASQIFSSDGGRLWGKSLDGPMIFVDPQSRTVVGNRLDAKGNLLPLAGVFTGTLPDNVMVANTSIRWSGTHWTMLLWPLPVDTDERGVLLAHEAWHRIQEEIGFPPSGAANEHLNSLEGRYWLQLEWRALSKALQSSGSEQKAAITDATYFRGYRHQLCEGSAEPEREMEMHEGLAEYTGVRLALEPRQRTVRATRILDERPKTMETFVRSFAYLSGPAYGLLLDQHQPDWRTNLTHKDDLARLLTLATDINIDPRKLAENAKTRGRLYGGESLRAAEQAREDERVATTTRLERKFVTGPRLILPLKSMRMSFNPNELFPLGNHGMVYPTLTITDSWGVLTVTDEALIADDFQSVIVAIPDDYDSEAKTEGWTLDLDPKWTVKRRNARTFEVTN